MHAVPFRLWEPKETYDESSSDQADVEPPKVAPACVVRTCILGHWTSDDGSNLKGRQYTNCSIRRVLEHTIRDPK